MTRLVRFSNNAVSRLAANLAADGTTISLTPGDGAKFPTITGSQFFTATLIKSDGTTEIVKVTARATDTLTVVRAAEPVAGVSTSYSFTAGDRIEQRLTAKALSDELDRLDSGANIGAANKTSNYTVQPADVSTLIRVDTTVGVITVTLPDIASLADDFDIMVAKVTNDANTVNVVRAGADLINGVTSYSLNNQWQSVWLIADRSTNTWTAINSGAGSTSVTVDTFTGSGTAGPFTLSGDPVIKANTAVYVGGVYQQKSTYTLSGTSLTLGGTVAAGVTVEVVWSQPVAIGRTDAALVNYDGGTAQDVLDGSKSLQDYAALRAYTGRAIRVYITGLLVTKKPAGIAGQFQYDPTDTTSADNGATVIVGTDGRRWKRDYSGAVQLGWFDINTTGAVPATASVQAAIDLLKPTGGTIDAPVGTITIGSINCTGIQKSIKLRGASVRDTVFSIKATDGIGFDCTGSQFLEFEDFTYSGNAVETPKVGFLFARNSTNGSAGRCRMRNVQSGGFFSVAPLYNYAAEEFKAYDLYLTNNSINADVLVITRSNVAGITSGFAAIATGSQSTTEYNFHNCAFNNYAVSSTGTCIKLSGVSSASFTGDTFMVNMSSGGKYVLIDSSVYPSSSLKFSNVMLDGNRSTLYGFYISGSVESNNIEIDNVLDYGLDTTNGYMVFGADLTQISYSNFRNLNTPTRLRFYSLKWSEVSHPMKGVELSYAISKCKIFTDSTKLVFSRPDLSSGNKIEFSDLGYDYRRSGATSPYGSVTPNSVGEEYLQTSTPPVIWKAAGLTNATWGVTAAQPLQGSGSPVTGNVAPRYIGDEYRDTTGNAWYKSIGTVASTWTKTTN